MLLPRPSPCFGYYRFKASFVASLPVPPRLYMPTRVGGAQSWEPWREIQPHVRFQDAESQA